MVIKKKIFFSVLALGALFAAHTGFARLTQPTIDALTEQFNAHVAGNSIKDALAVINQFRQAGNNLIANKLAKQLYGKAVDEHNVAWGNIILGDLKAKASGATYREVANVPVVPLTLEEILAEIPSTAATKSIAAATKDDLKKITSTVVKTGDTKLAEKFFKSVEASPSAETDKLIVAEVLKEEPKIKKKIKQEEFDFAYLAKLFAEAEEPVPGRKPKPEPAQVVAAESHQGAAQGVTQQGETTQEHQNILTELQQTVEHIIVPSIHKLLQNELVGAHEILTSGKELTKEQHAYLEELLKKILEAYQYESFNTFVDENKNMLTKKDWAVYLYRPLASAFDKEIKKREKSSSEEQRWLSYQQPQSGAQQQAQAQGMGQSQQGGQLSAQEGDLLRSAMTKIAAKISGADKQMVESIIPDVVAYQDAKQDASDKFQILVVGSLFKDLKVAFSEKEQDILIGNILQSKKDMDSFVQHIGELLHERMIQLEPQGAAPAQAVVQAQQNEPLVMEKDLFEVFKMAFKTHTEDSIKDYTLSQLKTLSENIKMFVSGSSSLTADVLDILVPKANQEVFNKLSLPDQRKMTVQINLAVIWPKIKALEKQQAQMLRFEDAKALIVNYWKEFADTIALDDTPLYIDKISANMNQNTAQELVNLLTSQDDIARQALETFTWEQKRDIGQAVLNVFAQKVEAEKAAQASAKSQQGEEQQAQNAPAQVVDNKEELSRFVKRYESKLALMSQTQLQDLQSYVQGLRDAIEKKSVDYVYSNSELNNKLFGQESQDLREFVSKNDFPASLLSKYVDNPVLERVETRIGELQKVLEKQIEIMKNKIKQTKDDYRDFQWQQESGSAGSKTYKNEMERLNAEAFARFDAYLDFLLKKNIISQEEGDLLSKLSLDDKLALIGELVDVKVDELDLD